MKKIIPILLILLILCLSGCNTSSLPKEMPDDFSFSIHFDMDGYYDSKTKELKNGYNYDLNQECKTSLTLSNEELKTIYSELRKINIDAIPEDISISPVAPKPHPMPYIEIRYGDYIHKVRMLNVPNYNTEEWFNYKDFGNVFNNIVEKYIKNKEEYKNLPDNQILYD